MDKKLYHSALKPEAVGVIEELDYYASNGSIVMAHDLTSGVLPEFYRADAIYSEPSWRDGYQKFADRAGVKVLPYNQYLVSIKDIIETLKVPAYILVGKHMLKYLAPHKTQDAKLFGYNCYLAIWYGDKMDNCHSPLGNISAKYTTLLDFNCGYGNSAMAMTLAGKKFICTDINRKCVAYVAKTYMGYRL